MLINMLDNVEIYYLPVLERKLSANPRKRVNDIHNTN